MMTTIEAPTVATQPIASLRHQTRRRTLVVVSTDEDCLSRHLLHAIELEFAGLDVAVVPTLAGALGRFEQPVALVLVDASLLGELRDHAGEIARRHPVARLALLQPGDHAAPGIGDILACPQIRSILPMNLKLDIWLAALRVILLGGEYAPFAFIGALGSGQPPAISEFDKSQPVRARRVSGGTDGGFRDLTAREIQILEFVARGSQNKVIASTLRLSEHTVKIHLHNIIRKLCVHNRTEAARFYLDCMAGGGGGPPPREGASAGRR